MFLSTWAYDYDGGNPATLYARYAGSGARVAAFGQGDWTPRVVDARTGATQIDLAGRGIGTLAMSSSGDRLVAGMGYSLQVLDARDGKLLYERVELESSDALLRAGSMHVEGSASALRRVHVLHAGGSYPLDSFAAQLLDPKRVRAAAAGIALAPAILPVPPDIALDAPASGHGTIEGGAAHCTLHAEHADGLLGFEVERDGVRLDDALVRAVTQLTDDGRKARIELRLPVTPDTKRARLRACAVGHSGAVSRPAFLQFEVLPAKR